MKLYYAPRTRAFRPRWLLEEMGEKFELVVLDLKQKDHKAQSYLRVHPLGQVPALEDGNQIIFESGAICAYLGDKYPLKTCTPTVDSPNRGQYLQWLFFSVSSFEPPLMQVFHQKRASNFEQRDPAIMEQAMAKLTPMLEFISKKLGDGSPFLLGENLTVPDVLLGSMLDLANALKLLADHPVTLNYLNHLKERPAYQRARQDVLINR